MTRSLVGITDFGDLAVLVPLAVVISIWLFLYLNRAAIRWILALSMCVGLTALLKIVFYACPPAGGIHSPSGHASLSTLVYGALALTSAAAWPGLRRVIAISLGAGFISTIAVSRVLLNAHSLAEVGLGLVVGIASLALFGYEHLQAPNTKVWPVLVAAGALISILHGSQLHAEEILQRITGQVPIHCG